MKFNIKATGRNIPIVLEVIDIYIKDLEMIGTRFEKFKISNKNKIFRLIITEDDLLESKPIKNEEAIWNKDFYRWGGDGVYFYCDQIVIRRTDLNLEMYLKGHKYKQKVGQVTAIKE